MPFPNSFIITQSYPRSARGQSTSFLSSPSLPSLQTITRLTPAAAILSSKLSAENQRWHFHWFFTQQQIDKSNLTTIHCLSLFPALNLTTPQPPKVAAYYESLPPLSESPSRSLLWLMKSIAAGPQKRRLSQTYDSTGYMVTAGSQLIGPLSTNPSYWSMHYKLILTFMWNPNKFKVPMIGSTKEGSQVSERFHEWHLDWATLSERFAENQYLNCYRSKNSYRNNKTKVE